MYFYPLTLNHLLVFLVSYVLYKAQQHLSLSARRDAIIKDHGCKPIRRFPEIENPFFEWRFLINTMKAYREHRLMDLIHDRYNRLGYTIRAKAILTYVYHTVEPENVKTILATKFNDWNLPDNRKSNLIPLLGRGIFTSDGPAWQHSRGLLRPNFISTQVRNLDMFESHIQHLLKAIPRDGSTFDLQDLFFRYTIDSATEFLFGESVNSLAPGASVEFGARFAEAFTRAQTRVAEGSRTLGLSNLLGRAQFKKDTKFIHDFVDRYIDRRLKFQNLKDTEKDGDRYVFLNELVKETQDPLQIRAELLNVLVAGRDTTASLLSNAWFVLAKRPDIWAKLRSEVDQIGSDPPTFGNLKEMKHLRAFLNESLRLHPVVPSNSRMAITDTVLPKGGGPDGQSPLFIPKKTIVQYDVYVMHRRKDLYGDNAEEFVPERWETIHPGWQYLPFNGGPRICVGQQFALTEASFVTVRLIQEFSCIESRDDGPWEELIALTLSSRNGTKVALTPAKS
ncbi:hypothetical protein MMC31_005507 [Peltigera leucophlebia]|nr:hypothetical protein [Peltigera leucophlebia]